MTATTLKLARALWIVPLAFVSALLFRSSQRSVSIPYFILFYCVAIAVAYLLPQFEALYQVLFFASKRLLVVCLFLIGAGITVRRLREAGPLPLMLGGMLWVLISTATLVYLLAI